jgi:plastocyanin
MARTSRRVASLLAAAALLMTAVAVGAPVALAGDPCVHDFQRSSTAVGAGTRVVAEACGFQPAILTVPAGETVTFRNDSIFPHLVTGANRDWGDRDEVVEPASAVSYTFSEPGVYPYSCAFHHGMTGAIVVGDGGPALAAAMAPSAGDEAASAVSTGPGAGDAGMDAAGILAALVAALAAAGLAVALVAWCRGRPSSGPREADAAAR